MRMPPSPKRKTARGKTTMVRLPLAQVRRLMRAHHVKTAAELVRKLLDENEERITSWAVLRETAGTARDGDFDGRLI